MFSKEKFFEVLERERYNTKHVAEWLNVSKSTISFKVNGVVKWTYNDILILIKKLGKRNVDYIFFS